MTGRDQGAGAARAPLTATVEGRRLRLTLRGCDAAFLIDPLPAKRGRALTREYLDSPAGQQGSARADCFAEAVGAANYALITGDHVQEFDAVGRYVQTWLPGARMVEPVQDVPAPATGQRVRIISARWDGLALRAEEVDVLALAAVCWQSPAGWLALDAFLSGGADRESATAIRPLLMAALAGEEETTAATAA